METWCTQNVLLKEISISQKSTSPRIQLSQNEIDGFIVVGTADGDILVLPMMTIEGHSHREGTKESKDPVQKCIDI